MYEINTWDIENCCHHEGDCMHACVSAVQKQTLFCCILYALNVSLSEVEERVKLWGILEQLIEKLKTRFPNTKLSRFVYCIFL